jgi:hypothetical protein
MTSPMNALMVAGSSQRMAATMALAGSIQVHLPPAPMAKRTVATCYQRAEFALGSAARNCALQARQCCGANGIRTFEPRRYRENTEAFV